MLDLVAEHELAVLGFARDSADKLKAYLASHPNDWTDMPVSSDAPILETYGVSKYPTYVLLDPELRVMAMGPLSLIKTALEQRAVEE